MASRELENLGVELGYCDTLKVYYKSPRRQLFRHIYSNHEIIDMFEDHQFIRGISVILYI